MADGKVLSRISITPAANGHTVEHHYEPKRSKSGSSMSYQEPESFVFGKGEHKKMLSHLTEHLGLNPGRMATSVEDDE